MSPDVNNHWNYCRDINVIYIGDFAQLEPVQRCSVGNSLEEEDMEDREKEDVEEQLAKRMLDYLLPYVAS